MFFFIYKEMTINIIFIILAFQLYFSLKQDVVIAIQTDPNYPYDAFLL